MAFPARWAYNKNISRISGQIGGESLAAKNNMDSADAVCRPAAERLRRGGSRRTVGAARANACDRVVKRVCAAVD